MQYLFSNPVDTIKARKAAILKLQDETTDQTDEKYIKNLIKEYGDIQLVLLRARTLSNGSTLSTLVNILIEDNFLSRSMPNFNMFSPDGQRYLLQIVRTIYESEVFHKIDSELYQHNMNDIAEMLIILLFSHISDDVFDSLFALVYVLVKKEVYLKIFLNSYNNVIFMDQRFSTSYGESLQDPVLLRLEAIYTVLFFDSKHSISIILESMTNRKEILCSFFSPNVSECGEKYLSKRLALINKFLYNEDYSIFREDLLTDISYFKPFLSLMLNENSSRCYSQLLTIYQLFFYFPHQSMEVKQFINKNRLILALLLSNHHDLSSEDQLIQDHLLIMLQKYVVE